MPYSISGNFLFRTTAFHSIPRCFLVWPALNPSSLSDHVSYFLQCNLSFLLASHLCIELFLRSSIHASLNITWELNRNISYNILACSGVWPGYPSTTLEEGVSVGEACWGFPLHRQDELHKILNSLTSSLSHASAKDFITFFIHWQFHQTDDLFLLSFPLIRIRKDFS